MKTKLKKKNHIFDYRFNGFVSRGRYSERVKKEKMEKLNNNVVKMNNGQILCIIRTRCRRNPSQTLSRALVGIYTYQYKRIL